MVGKWRKLTTSKKVRGFMFGAGVILATLFVIQWFDTTSVELPELTGPPIAYDHLSSQKTEPFLVNGKAPYKRANGSVWADRRAARRWPDVRSCLIRSERKADNPDLRKMNWGKMRRKEDIEVCLFRIAASLHSPEAMRDWFVSQGMQFVEVTKRKKLPNVLPEDMWVIEAGNSFSTGKTYRASPIPWRYWVMYISRGESFMVWQLKNGGVFRSYYSDANIL